MAGVVVGGYGGGIARTQRHFNVDDYGADPTGATNSNAAITAARTALGTEPGLIVFGVGTYLFTNGLNVENGTELGLNQGVMGQGASLTTVKFNGAYCPFEFRNSAWQFNTASEGGEGLSGMWLYGWENTNTNVHAIRWGDIGKMRIHDVHVAGFNQSGDVGMYASNDIGWSERADIECSVEQCSTAYLFEGAMPNGTNPFGATSFDYSHYRLNFVCLAGQDAFVLRSKAGGYKTTMNGVKLELTGNCLLSAEGEPNEAALFRIGRDNADQAALTGELYINVETSGDLGDLGVAHYDFMMGGAGPFWEVESKVSAFGTINLIPFSGVNFRAGTGHPRNFAFAGLLKNSPTFGSTTNSQAFQPLQLVSQARGDYWIAPSNAVQTIYVREATAGTFTIDYDGTSTPALDFDASIAEVQAALEAIPALTGNVTVVQGQARFINGYYADELAYGVTFGAGLAETAVPTFTVDDSGLTGTADVVVRNTGSANKTLTARIETGNIVKIEETAGTYRLGLDIGLLTDQVGTDKDSPFGLFGVDIWIKQPTTGGNVVLEGPWFVANAQSGSTATFDWFDGIPPVLSTEADAWDVIRISTYNFNVWIGQHITRKAIVDPPLTSTSPGVKGQRAIDESHEYVCVDTNSWKRTPISSW